MVRRASFLSGLVLAVSCLSGGQVLATSLNEATLPDTLSFVEKTFEAADRDGNSILAGSEIHDYYQKAGQRQGVSGRILSYQDTSAACMGAMGGVNGGSGNDMDAEPVTKAEILDGVKMGFQTVDINKDNVITAQEVSAMEEDMKQMCAQMQKMMTAPGQFSEEDMKMMEEMSRKYAPEESY